jgi:hypothetical protein
MKLKMYKMVLLACSILGALGIHAQTTSKIDGVLYADYFYNMQNSVAAEKNKNAFQFRRIYFTYENNITMDIKIRFRLESESNSYGSTAKINPFIKHAYMEWANLIPNHLLYLGISETNMFKNSEEYWGYRSIEKTLTDLNKISSSADFGIALKGDLNVKYLHHWLTVMNGTGYGASETDRFKKIGYALWLTPVQGLILEGYVDYEKQNPNEPQTAAPTYKDYTGCTDYSDIKVFAGYANTQFTLGAEAFQRTNSSSGIKDVIVAKDGSKFKISSSAPTDVKKFGYSLFASLITPIPKVKLFARYDCFDNNNSNDVVTAFNSTTGALTNGQDDEFTMLFAGLDYIPAGNVHFMPNIILKKYAQSGKDSDLAVRMTMYLKYDSGKIIVQ